MQNQPKRAEPGRTHIVQCAYLQSVVDSALETIITTDNNGSIDIFNQAAARLFGYRSDEVYGKDVSMLLGDHNPGQQVISQEVTGRHRCGRLIPLELTIRSVSKAGQNGFSYLLRDTSAHKEAECQAQAYQEHLERCIAERTKELLAHNRILAEMTQLDPLTNIANRRHFDERLVTEYRRMAREGKVLSVLMCDIDYFKNYNDTYGHIEGDRCLRDVAQLLQHTCRRPGDFVARYGGEEFALILPDGDPEHAMEMASLIKQNLATQPIAHRASAVAEHVTVSIGVSTVWPAHSKRLTERILAQADEALYRAKLTGRNRAARASHDSTDAVPVRAAESG